MWSRVVRGVFLPKTGRVKKNELPRPASLVTQIRPPTYERASHKSSDARPDLASLKAQTQAAPAEKSRQSHEQRADQKKRDKRARKIDDEIADLETRIASAEAERDRNDALLCSEEVFRDGERVKKIQQQNHDLKAMIELLTRKWEALSKEKEDSAED